VQFIKYYLEYEHTSFKGGPTARPAENTIFLRAQVSF
jgi:hypothetical protein